MNKSFSRRNSYDSTRRLFTNILLCIEIVIPYGMDGEFSMSIEKYEMTNILMKTIDNDVIKYLIIDDSELFACSTAVCP